MEILCLTNSEKCHTFTTQLSRDVRNITVIKVISKELKGALSSLLVHSTVQVYTHTYTRVSEFTGLKHWTGLLDWTTGLQFLYVQGQHIQPSISIRTSFIVPAPLCHGCIN